MTETTPVAPEAAPSDVPVIESPAVAAEQAAPPHEGAPETTPADEAAEDDSTDKPRRKASERISELYGRMKAAEREKEQMRAELERLRQPVVDPAHWDQMSFDDQQAAQMRHAVRSERADEVAREAQSREQEADRMRAAMFTERVASIRDQIPDIDTVLSDPNLPVSQVAARFIQESEKGPQVAYYLAQNRAEAVRIASLDPYSQAYELGRIEARIGQTKARKTSTAPPPVPTVAAGGSPGSAKQPGSMSVDEMKSYLGSKGVIRV